MRRAMMGARCLFVVAALLTTVPNVGGHQPTEPISPAARAELTMKALSALRAELLRQDWQSGASDFDWLSRGLGFDGDVHNLEQRRVSYVDDRGATADGARELLGVGETLGDICGIWDNECDGSGTRAKVGTTSRDEILSETANDLTLPKINCSLLSLSHTHTHQVRVRRLQCDRAAEAPDLRRRRQRDDRDWPRGGRGGAAAAAARQPQPERNADADVQRHAQLRLVGLGLHGLHGEGHSHEERHARGLRRRRHAERELHDSCVFLVVAPLFPFLSRAAAPRGGVPFRGARAGSRSHLSPRSGRFARISLLSFCVKRVAPIRAGDRFALAPLPSVFFFRFSCPGRQIRSASRRATRRSTGSLARPSRR